MKIAIGFLLLFLLQFGLVMYVLRRTQGVALLALIIAAMATATEVLIMFKIAVPLAALKYLFH